MCINSYFSYWLGSSSIIIDSNVFDDVAAPSWCFSWWRLVVVMMILSLDFMSQKLLLVCSFYNCILGFIFGSFKSFCSFENNRLIFIYQIWQRFPCLPTNRESHSKVGCILKFFDNVLSFSWSFKIYKFIHIYKIGGKENKWEKCQWGKSTFVYLL